MHHLLHSRPLDLDEDTLGQRSEPVAPRHAMALLARELGSRLHAPPELPLPASIGDRLWGRLMEPASGWAHARALARSIGPDDRVYSTGENPGFQLAAQLPARGRESAMSIFVHNIDRPRSRALIEARGLRQRIRTFFACGQLQVDYLRRLGLPEDRAVFVWDQTDTRFFCPGPVSVDKRRPVVMSIGLEQRDYRCLAEATHDLDLDVRISGFSRDTRVVERAFPATLPANMGRSFYSWPDLRQLYRDADVVAVSLFPNRYAAGVQGLMEAMASGRPVVVSATEGLASYIHPDAALAVPVGDAVAMRRAIQHLVDHPDEARERGRRGREIALERHTMERYVQVLAADARR